MRGPAATAGPRSTCWRAGPDARTIHRIVALHQCRGVVLGALRDKDAEAFWFFCIRASRLAFTAAANVRRSCRCSCTCCAGGVFGGGGVFCFTGTDRLTPSPPPPPLFPFVLAPALLPVP